MAVKRTKEELDNDALGVRNAEMAKRFDDEIREIAAGLSIASRNAMIVRILSKAESELASRACEVTTAGKRGHQTASKELARSAELVSVIREALAGVTLVPDNDEMVRPSDPPPVACGSNPVGPPASRPCVLAAGHHRADGVACTDGAGQYWPHPVDDILPAPEPTSPGPANASEVVTAYDMSTTTPDELNADITAYLAGVTDVMPEDSASVPASVPTVETEETAPVSHPAPEVVFVDPAWIPQAGCIPLNVVSFAELSRLPEPPAERPHRSISQVESFAGCGLKYRLQRRTPGVTSRPGWALVGGCAVHATIELIERHIARSEYGNISLETLWASGFQLSIAEFSAKNPGWAPDTWHVANRGREGYDWWRIEGLEMLRRYLAWRKGWVAQGFQSVRYDRLPFGASVGGESGAAFELEIRPNLGDVPMVMKLDSVWQHRDTYERVIIDYKTGAKTPTDRFQLKTYMVGLVDQNLAVSDNLSSGYLMLREGKLTSLHTLEQDDVSEVAYRVLAMDRAELTGIYLPAPGPFCSSCSVGHACPIMATRAK